MYWDLARNSIRKDKESLKLTFDDIQDHYLNLKQQKTKGIDRSELSESALDIFNNQKKNWIQGDLYLTFLAMIIL